MENTALQIALREWRRQIVTPKAAIVGMGVAGVLALGGPFGTLDLLPLAPRFAYWALMVAVTFSIGQISGGIVYATFQGKTNQWSLVLLAGGLTSIGVTIFVLALNLVFLGYWPSGRAAISLCSTILAVSIMVTAITKVLEVRANPDTDIKDAKAPPPILNRMTLEKRGRLIALTVEDHYVRIRSHKGEDVVLMRLVDAIKEVGDVPGLQVHRSHWVAVGEISSVRREKDRAILRMSTGPDIPVSRSNLPKLRDAGVLPK